MCGAGKRAEEGGVRRMLHYDWDSVCLAQNPAIERLSRCGIRLPDAARSRVSGARSREHTVASSRPHAANKHVLVHTRPGRIRDSLALALCGNTLHSPAILACWDGFFEFGQSPRAFTTASSNGLTSTCVDHQSFEL